MHRLGRISRSLGIRRRAGIGPFDRRRMPFRHKLMLALALEILALGFRQSETMRQDKGIVVETPSHPGNAIV